MAEMCIESLDDDVLLAAFQKSRCRMIYCGLESIDQESLQSVNKAKTNPLDEYERIIRKAQSYDIQIGAGLILGIEGMTFETFRRTLTQFNDWGIAYTKLTFLTYNPGTKVKSSMRKKGVYLTEDSKMYDGNHLTFIANEVDQEKVYSGSKYFIQRFYSFRAIRKRSRNAQLKGWKRLEFILFNLSYREVYLDWLKYEIFKDDNNFDILLKTRFKKSWKMRNIERALSIARRSIYKQNLT